MSLLFGVSSESDLRFRSFSAATIAEWYCNAYTSSNAIGWLKAFIPHNYIFLNHSFSWTLPDWFRFLILVFQFKNWFSFQSRNSISGVNHNSGIGANCDSKVDSDSGADHDSGADSDSEVDSDASETAPKFVLNTESETGMSDFELPPLSFVSEVRVVSMFDWSLW